MGHADLAIVYYELACSGQWDARFGDMHNIAQLDYFRSRRLAEGHSGGMMGNYARARLATSPPQVRDTARPGGPVFWNTDGTDRQLHATEPAAKIVHDAHLGRPPAAGQILALRDDWLRSGNDLAVYVGRTPGCGWYIDLSVTDANRAGTRRRSSFVHYQGWGTKTEKLTRKALTLLSSDDAGSLGQDRHWP